MEPADEAEQAARRARRLEALGQLTGGIAHDFNNLLAVILGSLELLALRVKGDEQADELVSGAVAATERGAVLVRRLLAFARQEGVRARSVAANDVISAMLELVERTIGERIEVETELADDLWPTFLDPGQLEDALLNLVINARDAMPDGGILMIQTRNVSIAASPSALDRPAAGEWVCVSVRDTGIGIPAENLTRVLEPFFTTKPGHGTGLGLSMVQELARKSGGHLALESAVGAGTSVHLFLPRVLHVEPSGARPRESRPPGAEGESILLVEHDAAVRSATEALLVDLGYSVRAVGSAAEAFEQLGELVTTHLLLVDLGLAGSVSGRELVREARRRRPDLAVLGTSGDVAATNAETAPELSVLQKPFKRAELASALRRALGRGRQP